MESDWWHFKKMPPVFNKFQRKIYEFVQANEARYLSFENLCKEKQ